MADRVQTQCDQCGQTDDHPKVHMGAVTKHHDCLSYAEEQALRGSAQEKGSGPKASAIIDACKGGTKGSDLVDLIVSGDLSPADGVAHQRQVESEKKGRRS